MTLVSSLNYVIWESYKPKFFRSIFVHFVSSVLWFWPWHFSISLKSEIQWYKFLDEIFTILVSSLNYVIWESYKPKTVSAPFLSIFVSSVLWFWPWHFSNFTQKWNSMVQVDRSRWDLYNDASFELKLCYLRKL